MPPLELTLKIGARKLSSPYTFVARVPLYAFILSRLVVHSQKTRVVPFFPSVVGGTNIRFRSLRTCVHDIRTASFNFFSFDYTDTLWFIHLM